jgi:excisionase family DNA binding protein
MSMHLTSAQAALRVGVSRWTITRAIKSGELRAIRDNKGVWLITEADLSAWRSAPDAPGAHLVHAPNAAPENAPAAPHISILRGELAALAVKLEAADAALEREREERVRERVAWERERETILERERETVADLRATVSRLLLALPAPEQSPERPIAPETAVVAPETPSVLPVRRGFLARLLRRS